MRSFKIAAYCCLVASLCPKVYEYSTTEMQATLTAPEILEFDCARDSVGLYIPLYPYSLETMMASRLNLYVAALLCLWSALSE